jgi:hypothetical protein
MGRLFTIAMCGVLLVGVGGCARRSPEDREAKREAKREAEASKYPPPPSSSPMAKIQPGMRENEVMKILGPPDDSKAYITGKAFIPWYYGPDATRFAAYYKSKGRVIFEGGNAWGAGRGRVVRVEYDPSEDGDATTK